MTHRCDRGVPDTTVGPNFCPNCSHTARDYVEIRMEMDKLARQIDTITGNCTKMAGEIKTLYTAWCLLRQKLDSARARHETLLARASDSD